MAERFAGRPRGASRGARWLAAELSGLRPFGAGSPARPAGDVDVLPRRRGRGDLGGAENGCARRSVACRPREDLPLYLHGLGSGPGQHRHGPDPQVPPPAGFERSPVVHRPRPGLRSDQCRRQRSLRLDDRRRTGRESRRRPADPPHRTTPYSPTPVSAFTQQTNGTVPNHAAGFRLGNVDGIAPEAAGFAGNTDYFIVYDPLDSDDDTATVAFATWARQQTTLLTTHGYRT